MNSSSALALLQCYSDSDNEIEETEGEKVIQSEPSVTVSKINNILCGNISPSQILFK